MKLLQRLTTIQDSRHLAILTIVCLVVQLAAFLSYPTIIKNDSVWYYGYSHLSPVQKPMDFNAPGPIAESWDLMYSPGYPLFLDLMQGVATVRYSAIAAVIVQHVLSLACVLMLFLLAKRLMSANWALVPAIALALYMPRLIYAQTIMSETTFMFAMLLTFCLMKVDIEWSTKRLVAIALCIVVALALRLSGLPLLLAPFYLMWRKRAPLPKHLSLGAIIAAGLFLILVHNHFTYGHFRFSTYTGRHLADRVYAYDKIVGTGPATEKLVNHLEASGKPYQFPDYWWTFQEALRSQSTSSQDADSMLLSACLEAILEHPMTYAVNTVPSFVRTLVDDHRWVDPEEYNQPSTYLGERLVWAQVSSHHIPPKELAARKTMINALHLLAPDTVVGQVFRPLLEFLYHPWVRGRGWVGYLLLAALLVSAASFRQEELQTQALFTVGMLLLCCLLEYPFPRYSFPVMGLIFIMTTALAYRLVRHRTSPEEAPP